MPISYSPPIKANIVVPQYAQLDAVARTAAPAVVNAAAQVMQQVAQQLGYPSLPLTVAQRVPVDPVALLQMRFPHMKAAPHVSQVNEHPTSAMNCGPTTMAMMVKHFRPDLAMNRDIDIIHALATIGGTTLEGGTPPESMVGMAHASGLAIKAFGGLLPPSMMDLGLTMGAKYVIAGDAYALPWNDDGTGRALREDAGHWIAVVGKNPNGTYQVNDPALPTGTLREMTAQQLLAFVAMRKGGQVFGHEGGFTLVIEQPMNR